MCILAHSLALLRGFRGVLGVSGKLGQLVGRPSIIGKRPISICQSSLKECRYCRYSDYGISDPVSSLLFFSQRYLLNLNEAISTVYD